MRVFLHGFGPMPLFFLGVATTTARAEAGRSAARGARRTCLLAALPSKPRPAAEQREDGAQRGDPKPPPQRPSAPASNNPRASLQRCFDPTWERPACFPRPRPRRVRLSRWAGLHQHAGGRDLPDEPIGRRGRGWRVSGPPRRARGEGRVGLRCPSELEAGTTRSGQGMTGVVVQHN